MKKNVLFCLAVLAAVVTISCVSTPAEPKAEAEPEAELKPVPAEEAAFIDAYQAVLPLIMDGAEHYTVKEGETLTKIARAKYGRGNAFFFPLIMAASNSEEMVDIVDPDKIEPGMKLVIPNLDANRANPEIRARIKTLLLSVSGIYKDRPETRWSSELIDGLTTAANSL
jgi:hypothetical protein